MTADEMNKPAKTNLKPLEKALGYDFDNKALLEHALTHKSLKSGLASYERLEFLGDRVLGRVLAETLYQAFPLEMQGTLTKRLHARARAETLAGMARTLELSAYIRTEEGNISARDSVLADVVEAILAAMYLDGGIAPARALIMTYLDPTGALPDEREENPKSMLQEWALGHQKPLPAYKEIERSGPAHETTFTVELRLANLPVQTGIGPSKKQAERAAAVKMLNWIQQQKG